MPVNLHSCFSSVSTSRSRSTTASNLGSIEVLEHDFRPKCISAPAVSKMHKRVEQAGRRNHWTGERVKKNGGGEDMISLFNNDDRTVPAVGGEYVVATLAIVL